VFGATVLAERDPVIMKMVNTHTLLICRGLIAHIALRKPGNQQGVRFRSGDELYLCEHQPGWGPVATGRFGSVIHSDHEPT